VATAGGACPSVRGASPPVLAAGNAQPPANSD